jgi:hypothetical protein
MDPTPLIPYILTKFSTSRIVLESHVRTHPNRLFFLPSLVLLPRDGTFECCFGFVFQGTNDVSCMIG